MVKIIFHLRAALVCLCVIAGSSAFADDYIAGWGPGIGSAMPVLQASDQTGTPRDLASLTGKKGLLLFVNRSADW